MRLSINRTLPIRPGQQRTFPMLSSMAMVPLYRSILWQVGNNGSERQNDVSYSFPRCLTQLAASAGTGPAKSTHIYRFTINDENRGSSDPGRMILQWERWSKENVLTGSSDPGQFVLLLIDRKERRNSRIATMTPDGLEMFVRKPSVFETLQVCFDLTEPVVYTRVQDPYEALEMWFYMQTLTLGGMGPLPGGMAQ